jgi:hypothetical protein
MASRIVNSAEKIGKSNAVPHPRGVAEKALQQSMFEGMDNAKEQREYLELLKLKSELRNAEEDTFGEDAPMLRAIAGTRSAEEAQFLSIYARLSKISEMDPRMLSLRSVFGNQSKMELAKDLAAKLISKRHAERVLMDVMGTSDDQFKDQSRAIYESSRQISEANLDDKQQITDPAALLVAQADPAGRLARATRVFTAAGGTSA